MAEVHRFGGDLYAALDQFVQASVDTAQISHVEGVRALQRDFQTRARRHPRWEGLADYIEAWDEGGVQMVGVRDPSVVEQARAAEYGDSLNSPAPLFRVTRSSGRRAADRMDTVLRSHLGTAGL